MAQGVEDDRHRRDLGGLAVNREVYRWLAILPRHNHTYTLSEKNQCNGRI